MCGIIGIVANNHHSLLRGSLDRISHRGPDDEGIFQDNYLSLGHKRLSIQDLSANGHQPMFSADGRYAIIFNGEIYNHWEIRETLKDKYTFKSSSDTETILNGFLAYGEGIFERLNGIFALAIYDTHTSDLLLVRDQFGVKPFYYYQAEGILAFSSEIKAFIDFPDFDATLNHEAIVNYLHFLYSPGEQTPYKHVKKLLGGHYIKLNLKDFYAQPSGKPFQLKPVKYYEIPFNGQYADRTEAQLIDELDEKLFAAVKRQLLSDVPVGFFLSGGLDSSAVVAMAKKAMPNKRLQCYTIDSGDIADEGFVNDLHYAKLVANHLDVDLDIVEGQIDIIHSLDKMVYHLDEPQADVAPLHVLNICKKARQQGYIVLLGGTAGDDLFSGYRRHIALNFEQYYALVPSFLRKGIKQMSKSINSNNHTLRRIKKATADIDKTKAERMAGYYAWIDLAKNKSLFTPKLKQALAKHSPSGLLLEALQHIPHEKNDLNQMLFWEMKYFLTDHNLNYTDKLSMAVGVEVRVPFLDKELVEFSTTIPPALKMKGKNAKYILKKVMERYLPHEVIYRSKSGFGAPVRSWILNELQPTIQYLLSKENIAAMGIFDYDQVQQLIKDNQEGKVDASYTILSLLVISSWYQQFILKKSVFSDAKA